MVNKVASGQWSGVAAGQGVWTGRWRRRARTGRSAVTIYLPPLFARLSPGPSFACVICGAD